MFQTQSCNWRSSKAVPSPQRRKRSAEDLVIDLIIGAIEQNLPQSFLLPDVSMGLVLPKTASLECIFNDSFYITLEIHLLEGPD